MSPTDSINYICKDYQHPWHKYSSTANGGYTQEQVNAFGLEWGQQAESEYEKQANIVVPKDLCVWLAKEMVVWGIADAGVGDLIYWAAVRKEFLFSIQFVTPKGSSKFEQVALASMIGSMLTPETLTRRMVYDILFGASGGKMFLQSFMHDADGPDRGSVVDSTIFNPKYRTCVSLVLICTCFLTTFPFFDVFTCLRT